MKYLKKFEGNESSDYYYEITEPQYNLPICIDMDKTIFNKLSTLIPSNNDLSYQEQEFVNSIDTTSVSIEFFNDDLSTLLQIQQLPDDWFIVYLERNMRRSHYKCDRWDGLLKFLSDFNFISRNLQDIMGYVKKFNEDKSNQQYYYQIDQLEYLSVFGIKLEYNIYNEIVKLLYDYDVDNAELVNPDDSGFEGIDVFPKQNYHRKISKEINLHVLTIFIAEDEWFITRIAYKSGTEVNYKCDRWDGLLKFLKDFDFIEKYI